MPIRFVTTRENFLIEPATSEKIEFRDTANDVLSTVTYGMETEGEYYRITEDVWLDGLFDNAISSGTPDNPYNILFFIHGLTNKTDQGIRQGITYQSLLKNTVVVPMHWSSAGFLGANLQVHDAARRTGAPFGRFINKVAARYQSLLQKRVLSTANPLPPRISVFCHSMGNMAFGHTLNNFYDLLPIFELIILASAYSPNNAVQNDSDNGLRFAPFVASKGVIIYHADDDMTLRYASLLPQAGGIQLGQSGLREPGKALNNVYQFDISRFNNAFDPDYGHDCYWTKPGTNEISPALLHTQRSLDQNKIADVTDTNIKQWIL